MKIKYVTEGFFKNPEQARAARAKEKETSNVDSIVSTSRNVIRNQILYKALAEDEDVVKFSLYTAFRYALDSYNRLDTPACPNYNNIANSAKFRGDGWYKYEDYRAKKTSDGTKPKWNMSSIYSYGKDDEIFKIRAAAPLLSSLAFGIWKDPKGLHSCKRIVMLEYCENISSSRNDMGENNSIKIVINPTNIEVNIYALVTGFDDDSMSKKQYLKLIEDMFKGTNSDKVDDYFINCVTEIVDIPSIKKELNNLESVFSELIYNLFTKYNNEINFSDYSIDKETFKEMYPVKVNLFICRTHLETKLKIESIGISNRELKGVYKEEYAKSSDLEKTAILKIIS